MKRNLNVRHTQQEKDKALAQLREWLKPGMTVHCVSRHTSRSGMSRSISLFAFLDGDNAPTELDYFVGVASGQAIDRKHGGIRVGGCGMDMGHWLVYNLSRTLFPDGHGCIGEREGVNGSGRCPSNDHSNGDRDYTPHSAGEPLRVIRELPGKAGLTFAPPATPLHYEHWHRDGGYALRHRWM